MGALTQGAANDINLLKGGSYSSSRDVIKHTIYDSFDIDDTISDHTYFQNQIGSPWKGAFRKTVIETNMTQPGRLPTMQTMVLKRIGVSLISPLEIAVADSEQVVQAYYDLLQSSVFEVIVAGRTYDSQIHGRNFIPPVAVAGAATTPARYGDMIASGWQSFDSIPIVIDNQVDFEVLQRLSNPDTAVVTILNAAAALLKAHYCLIQVALEGTLTRAK